MEQIPIVIAFVCIAFGLFSLFFPRVLAEIEVWKAKTFLGARFEPSKKTYTVNRIIGVIFLLVGVGTIAFMWSDFLPQGNLLQSGRPSFVRYPAGKVFEGTPAKVDFNSNTAAAAFYTRITEDAKKGPNFAGHYTVIEWGCGTSCQASTIVDTETGKIIVFGLPSSYGTAYRLDSRLFIVNPKENIPLENFDSLASSSDENFLIGSTPTASDYYLFEDGELIFLGKFDVRTGEKPVCAQVVTVAINPLTGEERTFPSPCHVPFGWGVK